MNRTALVADLGRGCPRTQWYRSDVLAVAVAACVLLALVAAVWLDAWAKVERLNQTDAMLQHEIALLTPRTAPIRAQLAQIERVEHTRESIFAQRRSGLAAATSVEAAGRALSSDAVATLIDSRGQVEGYASSYEALARIWKRLGNGYIVTSAEPSGSSIRFQIAPLEVAALRRAARP